MAEFGLPDTQQMSKISLIYDEDLAATFGKNQFFQLLALYAGPRTMKLTEEIFVQLEMPDTIKSGVAYTRQ